MSGNRILTLNAGSSSVKFALFDDAPVPEEIARGQIERIGGDAHFEARRKADGRRFSHGVTAKDHAGALHDIIAALGELQPGGAIMGIGHRITHGGPDFDAPHVLDKATLERLENFVSWAPLHQPFNLEAVEIATAAFPEATQVGCFDTAFHRGHDFVADAYALPRRYFDNGIRRYGFHGLSYEYVAGELECIAPEVAKGRVVIAHLGNGASMCALREGRSRDSTMGFTALDGLPMGTRCGQIDPGVLLHLMDAEGMSGASLTQLLYKESGLKGLSGIGSDMRTLEASDAPEAREAIEYFAYRIRLEIGALAAALGGLDALVFCGGIGENSALVREMACRDMAWLGIELDPDRNRAGALSIGRGPSDVLVIATDEERVIANATHRVLSMGKV